MKRFKNISITSNKSQFVIKNNFNTSDNSTATKSKELSEQQKRKITLSSSDTVLDIKKLIQNYHTNELIVNRAVTTL